MKLIQSKVRKFAMMALVVMFVLPAVAQAKGSVTGKAYLDPSAPKECVFQETTDTQKGCTHNACNTAVKNAIKELQDLQPSDACKAKAKSRGCKYNNCK